MAKITVSGTEVTIINIDEKDYISLTDMANAKESESRAADVIKTGYEIDIHLNFLARRNWFITQNLKWSNLTTLKWKNLIHFFKPLEFEGFKKYNQGIIS